MADLSLTCPAPSTAAGVTSINVTATGSVTITGAGETEVSTVGAIITVSGTPHTAGGGGGGSDTAIAGADGITVISGVPTAGEVTVSGFRTEFVNASGSLQSSIDAIDSSVTLQDAYDNGTGIISATPVKPVKVEGTISGTEVLAGDLTTSGQVTLNLPADENFLIDGATNQRQITVGAFRQLHTPAIPGTRALNYVIDTNNQADTAAIVAEYTTTGMSTGEKGTVYRVEVDTADSTGGLVESFHVTQVGSGSAEVHALHVGLGVFPIEQETGTVGSIENAFTFDDSGSSFADVTAAFNSSSSNVQLFEEDDDLVYIGDDSQFSTLTVLLDTPASNPGIKPEFEFWNGSSWTAFGPTDGTNGFRVNGTIGWEAAGLMGWATTSVNGTTKFWIRIRRTANNLNTLPTEELIQRAIPTLYSWNADGDVTINSLTAGTIAASGSLTVSGVPVSTGTGTSDHGDLSGLADDDHSQYLLVDGTRSLTGDWDNTSRRIRNTGTAEVIPTAPPTPVTGLLWLDTAASGVTGSGSVSPLITITTDTILTQSNVVILANAVSGGILVTLPTTAGDAGRNYSIKKIDATANTVTISGNSISELIDEGITAVITTQFESLTIVEDGQNWWIT